MGLGNGIFLQGNENVTFAPGAGLTDTVSGVIADEFGSGGGGVGATVKGSLTLDGPGTLVLAADNDVVTNGVQTTGFAGGITIENGTLDLTAAGAAGSGAITFSNASAIDPMLEFTVATAPTNAIDGFGAGDVLQIDDFLATSPATYANGALTLHGTDHTGKVSETVTLNVPGLTLGHFQVNVGSSDTVIDYVACYGRGTLIETTRGRQQKVEDLKIGDKVRTASGALRPIKWIGRRSYAGRFVMGRKDILPICFKGGSLADNVPERDLWISPQHAMYFASANHGGVLIEAKDLINGTSIVQPADTERVDYFHIELDTHDVIVAEGALSETFIDDDSRGIFHNAHQFDTLYADEPPAPAHYCAPRLSEGYEVEAVRQRLAQRAGLLNSSDTSQLGVLRGYIDCIRASLIAGWAQNTDAPEASVCLDIFADGKLLGRVLANTYREDLKAAGLGSGRHSFLFTPPAGLDFTSATIEIRRSLDGARLDGASASPDVRLHRRAAGA